MPRDSLESLSVGLTYVGSIAAGAFSTGVEIVHFFTYFGSLGLISVALAAVLFTIFPLIGLRYAQLTGFYDYWRFALSLIGPRLVWAFEASYIALVTLFLSAVMAAGGALTSTIFKMPYYLSLAIMAALSAIIVALGRRAVLGSETVLTLVKVSIITAATASIIAYSWRSLIKSLHTIHTPSGWVGSPLGFLISPILYVSYNLVGIPAMSSVAQDLKGRRGVVYASLIGGLTLSVMILLEYLATLPYYQYVTNPKYPSANLPIYYGLIYSGAPKILAYLYAAFLYIALLTATVGNVNAVAYRFEASFRLNVSRPAVSIIMVSTALVIALAGIYRIVSVGYTVLSYVFLALFTVPLAFIGGYRVLKLERGR